MGRRWKNFETHDRESLDCLEQTVNIKVDINESYQNEMKNMVKKAYIVLVNT